MDYLNGWLRNDLLSSPIHVFVSYSVINFQISRGMLEQRWLLEAERLLLYRR